MSPVRLVVHAAAALLLLAAPALAQPEPPPGPYDLTPKYTKGDRQETEARLSVLLKLRLRMESVGIDRTSDQEQVVHRRYQDLLTEVADGRVAVVERRFVSAWSGIREPGSPTMTRSFDPQHTRVIKIKQDDAGIWRARPKRGSLPADALVGVRPTERYEAALPKEPVDVGASWRVVGEDFLIALGPGIGEDPEGSMQCKLAEIKRLVVMPGERPEFVAVVQLALQASARKGREDDAPRMTTDLKGSLQFSLKRRKIFFVHLRGTSTMEQTRTEGEHVMKIEGRGPMEVKKRTWFPAKPKKR